MHRALLVLHRWVALVSSILILVVAGTGSALVFEGAIDRALNPTLWRVSPALHPVSLDSLAAHAAAASPGASVSGLALPREADRAAVAQVGVMQVFADPYTGAVLGKRALAEFQLSLPRRLHVLHTSLMLTNVGSSIVAIVTIAALFLTCTGLWLWWKEKRWRVRWGASWKRIVFDLHQSLGVVASLVLFVITASGITIHYDAPRDLINRLNSSARAKAPEQPAARGSTGRIALDSLSSVATRTLPGARVTFLSTPDKASQPLVAAMRFPEDRTPGGRSRVYVDRFTGTVLRAESTREAERGTAINNVMRSLHTGDILGKPTEAVWLFAALVLLSQSVTGFLMWWNGRRARAALAGTAAR